MAYHMQAATVTSIEDGNIHVISAHGDVTMTTFIANDSA